MNGFLDWLMIYISGNILQGISLERGYTSTNEQVWR
jgi:hypothetical protein